MKSIMNDPHSYEPVEFNLLTTNEIFYSVFKFDSCKLALNDFNAALIMLSSVLHEAKDHEINQKAMYLVNTTVLSRLSFDLSVSNIDSLSFVLKRSNSLLTDLDVLIIIKEKQIEPQVLDKIDTYRKKLEIAKKILDAKISRILNWCYSSKGIDGLINNKQVYWHSFRGNNKYGTLTLGEEVLVLSPDKTKVYCNLNIDKSGVTNTLQ